MKIALFHNLPAGGAKRALYEHAKALQARGHELDAYVMSTAAEDYLPLEPLCRRVIRPELNLSRAHLPWLTAPLGRLPKVLGRKAAGLVETVQEYRLLDLLETTYAQVAAAIDAGGYDVAYVHHCRFLLSPYLLKCLRTPSVYFCQDTLRAAQEWAIHTDPAFDFRRSSLLRRPLRGQMMGRPQAALLQLQEEKNAENARAATVTLANSWYSREALLRAYGIESKVCYLGVDSQFFQPNPDVRRRGVLSIGNLGHNKRHEFVIDSIATIPSEQRPSLRIIGYEVIGAETGFGDTSHSLGPVASALLRRAETQQVSLTLTKEVDDETLRSAYNEAQAVAFAPHLEPFGFIALEAMACAAPVVGVREGGLRETILDEQTGFLTDRDPQEFGAALRKILEDKALAAKMGTLGRQQVQSQWTWEKSTERLEHFLSSAARQ